MQFIMFKCVFQYGDVLCKGKPKGLTETMLCVWPDNLQSRPRHMILTETSSSIFVMIAKKKL